MEAAGEGGFGGTISLGETALNWYAIAISCFSKLGLGKVGSFSWSILVRYNLKGTIMSSS